MKAYRFIQSEEANHSVRMLCRTLEISRSSYYQWRRGDTHSGSSEQRRLLVHIRAIHRQHKGRYGAPRVTAELRDQGFAVNRKRVARIMRINGIQGRVRRRYRSSTTDSRHRLPVPPNLLNRAFSTSHPNKAFVGDITDLRTRSGWVYLAVLIDLFSRRVVGWAMDDTIDTSLCLRALNRALAARRTVIGAIHHSDRGSQYASRAYRERLANAGMIASMSRKADCWDNAVAESFFGTLKQELVPASPWKSLADARRAVSHYIHHYDNTVRRHSTIGQVAPADYEADHHRLEAAVA